MFDPYHQWLGIPKDQRPPTCYQLLGIASDEQDLSVIEEAVIRQTAHVRNFQTGPQAVECARLLNEIALARATLTNAAKRKKYDQSIRETNVPASSPHPATTPTEPAFLVHEDASQADLEAFAFTSTAVVRTAKKTRPKRATFSWGKPLLIALAMFVFLAGFAALLWAILY